MGRFGFGHVRIMLVCAMLCALRGAEGEMEGYGHRWQSDPIVLKDVDFDRVVNGSAMWMIDLYSPWCVG